MTPKIYTSPFPSVPLVERSIFTHLFFSSSDDPNAVGGFPGSAPAFIDAPSGTTLSRAQLKQLALSVAYGLRNNAQTRAKRGDTVLIYSQNSLAWPVVLFGSIAGGLRCTLANSAYNARELAFQYTDSGAKLIFTSEEGIATVKETFRELEVSDAEANKRIIVMGNDLQWAGGPAAQRHPAAVDLLRLEELIGKGALKEEEKFDGKQAHETVYLCYSSGTTGKPKGVETTHRNVTSLVDIVKCGFPEVKYGVDKLLGLLPFYHIYGAVKLLQFPFASGIPVIIMTRFDPVQFCANIERYKITVSFIVPPVLVVLSRHPAVDQYDMSSLKILFSGAAPLGAALSKQVVTRLASKSKGNTKITMLQGYGLTETSPTTHLVPVPYGERKIGSIGALLPNLEARLLVDGGGDGDVEATIGQPGELWIRGPTVMKGYLNNPSATKDSITSDGWFKTGDIAIRDNDGFYFIVDRRKELIKYKGFQVPPAELESVLLTHPDIADTAVIGVDSAKEATELPRAYVVHARPDTVKTEGERNAFAKEIQKWIQTKVARHKFLRGGVVVIDIIPKSAAGKILRRDLRERAKEELAGQDPADNHFKSKL
ncbi:AMP binding protein [Crucibulum laeve]|uniref:AMP binding protein n=1 Tax=Crucibulum laeve TaxID=68775 RepID=A0A5C3MHJ3_9AGAR|nr:AMP binding protein [Crucibulum laeve]